MEKEINTKLINDGKKDERINELERINEEMMNKLKDYENENLEQENELKQKIRTEEEKLKRIKEEINGLDSSKRSTSNFTGYYVAIVVAIIAIFIIWIK